ncbi:MAG: 50S ribosomal protein L30e [Candidatus Methanoperedens sp.]|nr:50S ribosomal protein L30e [Candidatus Methanoperedens sp.]
METDINKVLRSVLSTGKVFIGTKQTIYAVKNGKAQVVVVSSNCPDKTLDEIKSVPVVRFPESGIEMGIACGKPFPITAMAVEELGDSDILSFGSNE